MTLMLLGYKILWDFEYVIYHQLVDLSVHDSTISAACPRGSLYIAELFGNLLFTEYRVSQGSRQGSVSYSILTLILCPMHFMALLLSPAYLNLAVQNFSLCIS